MIELQGTLTERMEKAVALVCDEVTDAQVVHFHDIYTKAGISLSDAAVKFFKTYGGAYRSSYIVLSDPRYDQAVFFRCYGNDETTDNLDNAMEYIDLIETAAGQEVCPVAMIGFDIPAEVYVGANGLLYCMYEFKEEIDVFESPAQILESYLKNNIPAGVEKRQG